MRFDPARHSHVAIAAVPVVPPAAARHGRGEDSRVARYQSTAHQRRPTPVAAQSSSGSPGRERCGVAGVCPHVQRPRGNRGVASGPAAHGQGAALARVPFGVGPAADNEGVHPSQYCRLAAQRRFSPAPGGGPFVGSSATEHSEPAKSSGRCSHSRPAEFGRGPASCQPEADSSPETFHTAPGRESRAAATR